MQVRCKVALFFRRDNEKFLLSFIRYCSLADDSGDDDDPDGALIIR